MDQGEDAGSRTGEIVTPASEFGGTTTAITMPKLSKWQCGLFGNDPRKSHGVVWRPEEGNEPNWFWRWMQYLAFGNRWVKDK